MGIGDWSFPHFRPGGLYLYMMAHLLAWLSWDSLLRLITFWQVIAKSPGKHESLILAKINPVVYTYSTCDLLDGQQQSDVPWDFDWGEEPVHVSLTFLMFFCMHADTNHGKTYRWGGVCCGLSGVDCGRQI